jgi:hypothetical protein
MFTVDHAPAQLIQHEKNATCEQGGTLCRQGCRLNNNGVQALHFVA